MKGKPTQDHEHEGALPHNQSIDAQRVDELVQLHEHVADGAASLVGQATDSARRVIELLEEMKPHAIGETMGLATFDTPTSEKNSSRQLPSSIGRFEIKSILGQGGFGIVFLATDPKIDRKVAIKTPHLSALLDDQSRERFSREGRALAALNHPNIVPVFEVGNDGLIAYIVSEFIRGRNLAQRVNSDGVFSSAASAQIVSVLAGAVQHAHGRGIIHRDIKPANVLLDESATKQLNSNSIKLTDFGLAREVNSEQSTLTQSGSVIGTPAYSAPEQLRGEEVTVASDVYSLGAVLYFLLTGEAPFKADSIARTILDVQNIVPIAPEKHVAGIPSDLSAICMKCLEKDPADRYATAHELQHDLDRYLAGDPVRARQLSTWSRTFRWCKHNKLLASLVFISVAALTTTLISTSINLQRSEQLRRIAVTERSRSESKAEQLTDTIHRLFTAIVENPTALRNAEPLREQLLVEADALYQQVLDDDPDDDASKIEQTRAIFRLAVLKRAIGDMETSLELATYCCERADEFHPKGLIEDAEFLEWRIFEAERMREFGQLDSADQKFVAAFRDVGIPVDEDDFEQANLVAESNPKLRQYIAVAISKRASAMTESGNLETADKLCEVALAMWNQVDESCRSENPSATSSEPYYKAHCLAIRSNVLRQKGQFKDAQPLCEEAIALWRPMAQCDLARQLEPKRMLAESLQHLGVIVAEQYKLEEARELYNEALAISRELVENEPNVNDHVRIMTATRYSLGVTEMLLENYEVADSLIAENTVRLSESLEQSSTFQPQLNRRLANHFNLLYVIRNRSSETPPNSARQAIESAIKLHRETLAQRPDLIGAHLDLSQALNNLAEFHHQNGTTDSAEDNWLDSIEHCEVVRKVRPKWMVLMKHLGATHLALAKSYFESEQQALSLKHCLLAEEFLPENASGDAQKLRVEIEDLLDN